MKNGPPMIIEHGILYQLLAEREFWDRCPELAEFKEAGMAAHQEVVEKVLGKLPCLGCSTLRNVLDPLLNRMAAWLMEQHQQDPTRLDGLVAYIAAKRGYRPVPLIVYHRDAEQKHLRKLAF